MKFGWRYHIVLVGLLFFATSLLFAGKDKDKDKDDDNGDPGSGTLRIVASEPDLEAGTLLITGFNFSKGDSFNGVVKLFFPPEQGPTELTVIEFDPAVPQMILAGPLTEGIEDFPGTYVLQVRRGGASGDKDKDKDGDSPGSKDDIDVTFGAVGPEGPTGPQGEQGKVGPEGPLGPIGSQGEQGKIGPQGDQGKIGTQGEQGKIGPLGPLGPTGPTGLQGSQGKLGPEGPQGPQGKLGPEGVQGVPGPTGPTGLQGDQGPQGKLGPQGDEGVPGPTGPTGLQGQQGKLGPEGDQGVPGPTGSTGPQGDQGLQGKIGPIGDTGPQGAQGKIGPIGDTGPQGEQGKLGPEGDQGVPGPTGPTGDQGAQGKLGPQGVPGPNVVDGSTTIADGVLEGFHVFDNPDLGAAGGPFFADLPLGFQDQVLGTPAGGFGLRGSNTFGDNRGTLGFNGSGIIPGAGVLGETAFGGDVGVFASNTAGGLALSADSLALLPELITERIFNGAIGDAFPVSVDDDLIVNGSLMVNGVKNFVQAHPTDPGREIQYVSLEGNESRTYFTGSSVLGGGVAEVDIPEDWKLVTEEEGVLVHLTPKGAAMLWVELESRDRIQVKGTADVPFNYIVYGVRRGFADHEPIQENLHVRPRHRGVQYLIAGPEEYRRILVENGILNPDFTPNEETARRLGWSLTDPPPGPRHAVGN